MLLLKGLIVASSLGFLAFAALVRVPAMRKLAPRSPLLLPPAELAKSPLPEPQPAGVAQRYVVSSRAIRCTPGEGCSCGSEQWVWSDGTQLKTEELTRMGGGSPPNAGVPKENLLPNGCPVGTPECHSFID